MSKHKWLKGRPSVCALCGYVEGNLMTHEQLKCDNGFPPLARILIEFINHSQQRYDTCGDYFLSDHPDMPSAGEVLHVKVSRLPDRREMLLVAIHELGVDWLTYSRHIEELSYNNPPEPLP